MAQTDPTSQRGRALAPDDPLTGPDDPRVGRALEVLGNVLAAVEPALFTQQGRARLGDQLAMTAAAPVEAFAFPLAAAEVAGAAAGRGLAGTPQQPFLPALGREFEANMRAAADVMPGFGRVIERALEARARGESLGIGDFLIGMPPFTAFHGGTRAFRKFNKEFIGSGQGAQSYGHGIYLAENPSVARSYQTLLTSTIPGAYEGSMKYLVRGIDVPKGRSGHAALDTATEIEQYLGSLKAGSIEHAAFLRSRLDEAIPRRAKDFTTGSAGEDMQALKDFWSKVRDTSPDDIVENRGVMMQVRINADPEDFLDWDKPLSQQSEKVQKALGPVIRRMVARFEKQFGPNKVTQALQSGSMTGEEFYHRVGEFVGGTIADPRPGVTNIEAASSKALQRAGIPGIRYLDQGSRITPVGVGRATDSLPTNTRAEQIANAFFTNNKNIDEAEKAIRAQVKPEFVDDAIETLNRWHREGLILDPNRPTRNIVLFDESLADIQKINDQPAEEFLKAIGETVDASARASQASWFTRSLEEADNFARPQRGVVSYVDVPNDVLKNSEQFAEDIATGGYYKLPTEFTSRMKRVPKDADGLLDPGSLPQVKADHTRVFRGHTK